MKQKIGFIGAGNMASSLIGGLLASNTSGVGSDQIHLFDPSEEKVNSLVDEFGVKSSRDNQSLIARVDVVVIAVKPQALQQVLHPLRAEFKQSSPLIVSVVAGITSAMIESWLETPHAVARVMPNTPALVGAGASGMYANERVSAEQRSITETLMRAVGLAAWVNEERDIDSVTALSGSGPAYFMLFIQGLIDAAVKAGLDPSTASRLTVQTAIGAAELISASDKPLQTLIENVTSPGGTTEQALKSFAESGLTETITTAFEAARRRSETLAEELV